MPKPFIDISMLGDKELVRAFGKMEQKVQRKLARSAMFKAADVALKAAQAMVPVDTGALRDSLHKRTGIGRRGLIGARIETGTRDELAAATGRKDIAESKHYYPAVVEYRQKPFLRPAIDENEAQIVGIFARELRAAVMP